MDIERADRIKSYLEIAQDVHVIHESLVRILVRIEIGMHCPVREELG